MDQNQKSPAFMITLAPDDKAGGPGASKRHVFARQP